MQCVCALTVVHYTIRQNGQHNLFNSNGRRIEEERTRERRNNHPHPYTNDHINTNRPDGHGSVDVVRTCEYVLSSPETPRIRARHTILHAYMFLCFLCVCVCVFVCLYV